MKNDKVWIVTGASKGLGLSLVRVLLSRGYRVAASSRSLSDLTRELGEKTDRFLPFVMDPTDEAAAVRGVQVVQDHFGSLDVLVNNAGYGQFGTVEETTDAEARRNFDVNVFGTLNVLRAALPAMRRRQSGHVFNISSIGGYVGAFSGWGIYCATKFALSGLTEALHADLRPLGVKVTLVYPGYFRTSFLQQGSLARPSRPIADYAAARASEIQHSESINGKQPGDPDKAALAMIQAYEAKDAPLHLFLGSDAVAMAESKQAEVQRAVQDWKALSISTDY